jgi:hypothetical protein
MQHGAPGETPNESLFVHPERAVSKIELVAEC